MVRLSLKPVDIGRDEFDDLKLELKKTLRSRFQLKVTIFKSDINCENQEKIFEVFDRRLNRYFDDVRTHNGYLTVREEVPTTLIGDKLKFSKAPVKREKLVENLRNAADDVFGVCCE